MMSKNPAHHIQRVFSAASDKTLIESSCPDTQIVSSWERCLKNYDLDPARTNDIHIVERIDLLDYQESVNEFLGDFVKEEMGQLYQRISGSGYSVLLTSCEGVIINYVGDTNLSKPFQQAGLRLGALWNEAHVGTNGIGTCVFEKKPVTIHQDDHFHSRHINLTCTAAPIFDTQGQLIAVLDVSTANTNDSKILHSHTEALVGMSARLIEHVGFLRQCQRQCIVRFHPMAEYIGHVNEGILAVSELGHIELVNQNALHYLGVKDRNALIGKSISEVFSTDFSFLISTTSKPTSIPIRVHDTKQNRRFFISLRLPETPPQTLSPADKIERKVTKQRNNFSQSASNASSLEMLAGTDIQMQKNVYQVRKVVDKNIPILIQGETGAGKEAFAKAIHQASCRSQKPFVALNCAAIPESLIESELFGYKHGAFTGARREGMRGKILQSNEGTLFLDEIGDMPPQLQTRLLRVLEEREVLPLGCEEPIQVTLNLISATHQDLKEAILTGRFREDLYYRLNGITLALPALRERSDLKEIIYRILASENTENMPVDLAPDTLVSLLQYAWPGNVRQLRNVLRTALALCEHNVITQHDLPSDIVDSDMMAGAYNNIDESCIQSMYQQTVAETPLQNNNVLQSAEREVILQELERYRWNITNTANSLNMSRNTLYRKMKKHSIALPSAG